MTSHIQILGTIPRIRYVADGTTKTFEFPFAIFKEENLNVYIDDVLQSSSTYSITGVNQEDGGSITFETEPQSGKIVSLVRNLAIERTSEFEESNRLRANELNNELNYQTACMQQIADNLNRSMVLPPYAIDTNVQLTLPTPSAGKAIVWNSSGTNLENSTIEVNNLENTIKGYKTAAETAATTATTKAGLASDKAEIATTQAQTATTQAGIATAKATEVSNALSTKANTAMDNLTTVGKSTCLQYTFPSTSYVEITAPTVGVEGTYLAPANGYMVLSCNVVSTKFFWLLNTEAGFLGTHAFAAGSGTQGYRLFCPIAKGQTARFIVEAGSYEYIRFYYAQGEI